MARYTAERENYTPTTAANADIAIDEAAANHGIAVLMELIVTGTAAASAVNRQGLVRATTNGVTPTAITLTKENPASPTALATAASTYGTTPTLAATNEQDLSINAFGGVKRRAWSDLREGFWLVGDGGAGFNEAMLTANHGAGGGTQNGGITFEEL